MAYQFHKDWFKLSAANFREGVKDRYPKIKKKDLDALVDEYYGTDDKVEDDGEPNPIPPELIEGIE